MNEATAPPQAASASHRDRPLAITAAATFCVSSAFPVIACLAKDTSSFPRWYSAADVTVAFALAGLAIALAVRARRNADARVEAASYRAYRVLANGILVMLVIFFVAGDRITWTSCLPGFAWRAWLLLYALPAWIVAMRTENGLRQRVAS